MKNILISILTLIFSFTLISCVEDDIYKGPATITNVSYTPNAVTPDDPVTVTAKASDLQDILSAKIRYSLNGITQADIDMVSSGNGVFTGIIPKQADQTVVSFTVSVLNQAGFTTVSKTINYTVGAIPTDYTQLVLNEIDGNSKSIELYNKGTVDIPLEGISLVKNDGSSDWWTGVSANGSIPAGGYIVIIQSNSDPLLSGASGISTKQSLKFELKDPNGNSLGIFLRGNENDLGGTISDIGKKSYQRTPNGTGDWKMAAPTNGTANPDSGETIPQS